MLSIGILMGLIAMLCWGVADFLQAIPIRKIGSLKTMFLGSLLGLIITIIFFIYYLLIGKFSITSTDFILLCIGALFDSMAIYFFLRSFEIGEISIVAPISASYSFVTITLAILFLGERLSFAKIIATIVIISGIMLTSTDLRKLKSLHTVKGVKESLVALFGWGIYFFIIGIVSKTIDFMNLFIVTGLVNGLIMSGFAAVKGGIVKLKDLNSNLSLIFIANAVIYTIAWFAINYGVTKDLVSLVTPVSSLYPAITVILAVLVFREKLLSNQKLGILTILAGIFLISL
jgi:drug/metabolite transporter (DMT)-like permease